jgi:hypothetical protein
VALTTHLFPVPGCEWFRAIPPPALCASIGMSWADLFTQSFMSAYVSANEHQHQLCSLYTTPNDKLEKVYCVLDRRCTLRFPEHCCCVSRYSSALILFFLWRRAPQQMLRTHRSLKAYCAALLMEDEKDDYVFIFISNGAPVE